MDPSENARSCLDVQEPETAHERNPKRRKVALACTPCRNRKTRCDGARPICSCCRLRRSKLWSSCVYENKNNGTSSEGYQTSDSTQSLLSRIQQLEQRLAVTTNQKDESSQRQDSAGCQPVNLAQEPMSQISETNIQTLSQSASLSAFTAPDQKVQEPSYRCSVYTKNSARDFDATTGPLLDDPFITEPRGVVSGLPRASTATDSEGRCPGESCQRDQTSTFSTSGRYKFQSGDAQAAQYIRRHDPLYVTQEKIMDLACPDAPNQRELSNINAEFHSSQKLRLGAKSVSPHADSMDAMGIVPITTETSGENRHSYHGQTTTVSFMEELQSTVLPRKTMAVNEPLKSNSDRLEPSPYQSAEMLLQLKPAGTCFGDIILPPHHMADHLLQSYWDHVSSLYPFLHRPTFHYAYEQLWVPKLTMENLSQVAEAGIGNSVNAGPSSKLFHCALNAIFALGCQFSEIPVSDRLSISNSFIRRALDLFQVDIMDNGCLSLVQTILLLVQYLQSTTLSNRCWNLIGMACRTSQSLGLHTEDQRSTYQGVGLEVRRRVWYSCLSLDVVFSMTLGRPMMVSDDSIIPLPSSLDHEDSVGPVSPQHQGYVFPKTIFFVEAIKLYRILGSILSSIYQRHSNYSSGWSDGSPGTEKGAFPGHEHFGNTFRLESLLTNFASNLPPELQWVSGEKFCRAKYANSAMVEKQRNVLRARYLHLRILLYRPSFTSFCKRSRAGTTVLSISNTIETAADSVQQAFEARCAALCVCAAKELVALIHSSSKTPATGAWWYNVFYMYTAGVVITMAFLHNPTEGRINTNELKDSWEQCQETLEGLQPRGQSAKQCLDSLQALRSRVSSYKTGQMSELGLSVTKSAGAPGSNKAIDVSDPNENRKAQMSPPNVPQRAGDSSLEYETEGFSYRDDLTMQDTGYAESLFDFEEIWAGPTFELFSEAL